MLRLDGSGFGAIVINGGFGAIVGYDVCISYDFDFDSLYCENVPNVEIFNLFFPLGTGFDLALSRCSVLPDFSISKISILNIDR